MSPPRLLAIGGPTASGKTALAIALSEQLQGEIVNADARQVYRGMDIGTAKPTPAERARVPHHLLDVVNPDGEFSLALYLRLARNAIEEISGSGRLPIVAGGTGLYVRAVTRGYAVPEVAPNRALRRELQQQAEISGPETLVERLRRLDPVGADRIDVRNMRRVARAIEVSEALGIPFSALQKQSPVYNSLVIVLEGERSLLCERADARLDGMIEQGFADEVAGLIGAGYGLDLPAMSALGYRELGAYTLGRMSLGDAVTLTRQGTHAFIKRQMTWFRAERPAVRLDIADADLPGRALRHVRAWLEARDT